LQHFAPRNGNKRDRPSECVHINSSTSLQHPSLKCTLLPPQTHSSRGGCSRTAKYLLRKDAADGRKQLHESADMAGGRREVDQRAVPAHSYRHGATAAAAGPWTRTRYRRYGSDLQAIGGDGRRVVAAPVCEPPPPRKAETAGGTGREERETNRGDGRRGVGFGLRGGIRPNLGPVETDFWAH
jgi:hypothetical protein